MQESFRAAVRWCRETKTKVITLANHKGHRHRRFAAFYAIGSKNSRHFVNQSGVKPKPIATRSQRFSRLLLQLHVQFVFTKSFDWFNVLSIGSRHRQKYKRFK